MRFGVVADDVSVRRDVADKFRADPRELSHEKESGANLSPFEKREQLRSEGWVGAVVESQSDLRAERCATQRGPEELRRGVHGAPRGDARSDPRDGWQDDGPGIHARRNGTKARCKVTARQNSGPRYRVVAQYCFVCRASLMGARQLLRERLPVVGYSRMMIGERPNEGGNFTAAPGV